MWQTSAASFEYQQIPVQDLVADVPTRLPQRAFAHVLRLDVFLGGRSLQVRLASRQGRQTSSRDTSRKPWGNPGCDLKMILSTISVGNRGMIRVLILYSTRYGRGV
jgi:hypothetical protein